MLEARLDSAALLKRLLDSIKELVEAGNLDCNDEAIKLQAMDNAHVSLVSFELKADGFEPYRCDRQLQLGISMASLTKVLRCANNDDIVTLKADDGADMLNLTFESPKTDRVGEYELKLMDIDQEHLGIPETDYDAVVRMASSEFRRIVADLGNMGESVRIDVSKEGVAFSTEGEIGQARLMLKQGSGSGATLDDEDDEDDEDEDGKRKRKRAKRSAEEGSVPVQIELNQAINLTFSLKYLNNFAKAAPLSQSVSLHMGSQVPLLVEFAFENGWVRYFLAPKLADDEA